jgi:hypothetical protein
MYPRFFPFHTVPKYGQSLKSCASPFSLHDHHPSLSLSFEEEEEEVSSLTLPHKPLIFFLGPFRHFTISIFQYFVFFGFDFVDKIRKNTRGRKRWHQLESILPVINLLHGSLLPLSLLPLSLLLLPHALCPRIPREANH